MCCVLVVYNKCIVQTLYNMVEMRSASRRERAVGIEAARRVCADNLTLLRSAAARAVYCRTEKRGETEKWACDTFFEVEVDNWAENGVCGLALEWGIIVSSSERGTFEGIE